jgi:hypothetical protein
MQIACCYLIKVDQLFVFVIDELFISFYKIENHLKT